MHEKPKLSMMERIAECGVELSCAVLKLKDERRMMLKLRGGMAVFQIEMGRWHGVKREERVCKECDSGEVEDVGHWLLQCSAWDASFQKNTSGRNGCGKARLLRTEGQGQSKSNNIIINCM